MTEIGGLTEALMGLARTLTAGYDADEVLYELTGRLTAALGIAGSGVSLHRNGLLRFVAADHEWVAAVERLQEETNRGPSVDAWRSGDPVLVPELAEEATRWPECAAGAGERGIVAVAALPMRNSARIGALDLYDTHRHEWSDQEVAVGRVFSDIATCYVLHANELQRERRTVEQLKHALDSRIVIEQAKGIIAAERRLDMDQAFAVLRKHANDRNATLRAIAEAVVNLGLRP